MKTPEDPRNSYLAAHGVESTTTRCRCSSSIGCRTATYFLLGDRKSGEVRRVFRDESKSWVEVVDEVRVDRPRQVVSSG
jgi:hypothetical protein